MSTKHKKIHRDNGDKSQIRDFRKAVRDIGCDPSEERFQDALRTVAKHKPHPEIPKKAKPA